MRPGAKLARPVEPPAHTGKPHTSWGIIRWLGGQQISRGVLAAVISVIAQVGQLATPFTTRWLIDRGITTGDARAIWTFGVLGIALAMITVFAGITRHRIMTAYRTVLRAIMIRAYTRHVTSRGAVFSRQVGGGEMATAASTDLDRLAMLFTSLIPGTAALLGLLGGLAVMWFLSPFVFATAFGGLVVMMLLARPIAGWFYSADVAYRGAQGDFNNVVSDVMNGLRILTGIGGKARYRALLDDLSATQKLKGERLAVRQSALILVVYMLPSVVSVLVVWTAADQALRGNMTVGEFVQAVTTATLLVGPMYMMNDMFRHIPTGLTAAKRVAAIFDMEPDVADAGKTPAPSSPAVLRDTVTGADIVPGKLTGIVAEKPSDAEALCDRLARFAEEDGESQVLWGGKPLSTYQLADVRSSIVLGESQAFFLPGTLRELLSAGREVSDEEINDAIDAAHARDIVTALPDGLDTVMPTGAANVSGGQRQRLRLARLLLLNPPTALLVEPTSALDATTESVVASNVAQFRAGKTTAVVSSSPLVLPHADQVVFLPEDGTAVVGEHRDLLESDVAYRALVLRDVKAGQS